MKRRLLARVFVITTLLMASIPRAATAQVVQGSRQNRQQIERLLLIVGEAERIASGAEVRKELKKARFAIEKGAVASEHLRETNDGGSVSSEWFSRLDWPAVMHDISLARDLLRHIVDEPRGEGLEFQEKVAEALKVLDESTAAIWGDGTSMVPTETGFGLHTATFDTLQGTVTANLPDDLTAGDTISGTVIAEAKGKTQEEKAQNQDQLNGYVVELANQPVPVDNKVARWAIPATAAASIPLILKGLDGKEVARAMIPATLTQTASSLTPAPLYPQGKLQGQAGSPEKSNKTGSVEAGKPPFATDPIPNGNNKAGYGEAGKHPEKEKATGSGDKTKLPEAGKGDKTSFDNLFGVPSGADGSKRSPLSYAIPALAQAGKPIAVKGPFDGNFATTAIKIANQPAEVLAESPRQAIAKAPTGLMGPAKIQVMKRDQVVAERDIIAVGVRLSAAKLNLVRGETTTMTVSVVGGESAKVPIFVNLVNQSPWVVRMEGGQRQRLTFDPSGLKGGSATMQRTLTGLRAGGFAINATVEQSLTTDPTNRPEEPRSNPNDSSLDSDRWEEFAGREGQPAARLTELAAASGPQRGDLTRAPVDPARGVRDSACPDLAYRFSGRMTVTTSDRYAAGPFARNITFEAMGNQCRPAIRMVSFPALTLATFDTPIGRNTTTVTLAEGGSGAFNQTSGRLDIPVTFHFDQSVGPSAASEVTMTLSTAGPGGEAIRMGRGVLEGSGRFTGGALDGSTGNVVLSGDFSINPSSAGADLTKVQGGPGVPESGCSDLSSTFSGRVTVTTSGREAAGPFTQDFTLRARFTECRSLIEIVDFPAITLATFDTPIGRNTTTVTLTAWRTGAFDRSSGRMDVPVTLHFDQSIGESAASDVTLTLSTAGGGDAIRMGRGVLAGSGRFRGGLLDGSTGNLVVTGSFSPNP